MLFFLIEPSHADLEVFAQSQTPATLQSRAESGALPPAHVAVRALKLRSEGHPPPWATTFLIVRTADDRIVGSCGFKRAPIQGRVDVGYGVAPSAQRQGAATEALALLEQLAFDAGAIEVLAEIIPDNMASARVVTKMGFMQIGSRVDEQGDCVMQWIKRKSP